jgi:hypothetical protein
MESIHGLMSQVIKDRLFNQIGVQALTAAKPQTDS